MIENTPENNIKEIEATTLKFACDLLKDYNSDIREYLVKIVESLCEVPTGMLLTDTGCIDTIRARWLYWYAYRYLTDDSFDKIAKHSEHIRKFSSTCVCASVSKMSMLIAQSGMWAKRWYVLKQIIKTIVRTNSPEQELFPTELTLKVIHPKGVSINIKTEQQ